MLPSDQSEQVARIAQRRVPIASTDSNVWPQENRRSPITLNTTGYDFNYKLAPQRIVGDRIVVSAGANSTRGQRKKEGQDVTWSRSLCRWKLWKDDVEHDWT